MQATINRPGRECGTFDRACERAAEYANRHGCKLVKAEEFLIRAGWGRAIFGIERVSCADRTLRYINTGDTYSLTLGREGRGEVFTTSWGDWYEQAEREHEEEEGVVRCGYCGEFTPYDEDTGWYETVCEHCGHYVDGSEGL